MCRVTNHQTKLPRATSSLALSASRDGASTTSLGNLFQCVTTLCVKNFLLISNLNLPYLSLRPFPLVLSLFTLINSRPLSCICSLQVLGGCNEVSLVPFLLQAKQAQFPQSFLTGVVLQPSHHLVALLWTRSNSSTSFLCWGPQNCTQYSRWGLMRSRSCFP